MPPGMYLPSWPRKYQVSTRRVSASAPSARRHARHWTPCQVTPAPVTGEEGTVHDRWGPRRAAGTSGHAAPRREATNTPPRTERGKPMAVESVAVRGEGRVTGGGLSSGGGVGGGWLASSDHQPA